MNEKEFKNQIAEGIKNISLALSSDFTAIEQKQLILMVNFIYDQIITSKLTTDIEPYQKAFKAILSGKTVMYKLNVINLMTVFRAEISSISTRPKKW
jgi:hypothetical protein